MKHSLIVKVEFHPWIKWIYVHRRLKNGITICRGYRHTHRRVTNLLARTTGWRWVQPHASTPSVERP